jgi:hypothetical protein
LPKVTARTQERSVANQNRRIRRQIKASIKKPKAGANAKPGASEAKAIKVREGENVPVLLSGGNPRIAKADGDLDIREDDQLDEAQMATWIRQAATLRGWVLGFDLRVSRQRSM